MSLVYEANFLSKKEADNLFKACETLEFTKRQNPRNKQQFLKRGTLTFQDSNVGSGAAVIGVYHNSVVDLATAPVEIQDLRDKLTKYYGRLVNYLSLNRYPDGTSGIGWHNHKEDVKLNTPVLLVSIGSPRTFWVRKIKDDTTATGQLVPHGSLLIMPAEMNLTHQHAILPEPKIAGVRYSFNCKCLETK